MRRYSLVPAADVWRGELEEGRGAAVLAVGMSDCKDPNSFLAYLCLSGGSPPPTPSLLYPVFLSDVPAPFMLPDFGSVSCSLLLRIIGHFNG